MKSRTQTKALLALGMCIGAAMAIEHAHNGYLVIPKAHAAAMNLFSTEADMKTLIGRNIKNDNGDTVGEVKSVMVGGDGKISKVIVSVGGFLGVGDREVAINWNDLSVTDEGKSVRTSMTKDQLKAMPEYKYTNASWRGTVFKSN